jgi:phosphohistidine phosphatase SixA
LVICSTAMRARQTLNPIAKAKKPPKVVLEREIYGGAQRALWEQLWNLPELWNQREGSARGRCANQRQ